MDPEKKLLGLFFFDHGDLLKAKKKLQKVKNLEPKLDNYTIYRFLPKKHIILKAEQHLNTPRVRIPIRYIF
jgi:hypothetical protein